MPDETGATAPPKPAPRKRPVSKAAKQPKESRAEEIVHELFRLAKVDLRASEHGTKLARELGAMMGGK